MQMIYYDSHWIFDTLSVKTREKFVKTRENCATLMVFGREK